MTTSSTRFAALVGPPHFIDVHVAMKELVEKNRTSSLEIHIRNIALDMESTWGLIRDHILKADWPNGLKWQSLMVDAGSRRVKKFSDGSIVSVEMAKAREGEIRRFFQAHRKEFQARRITFECKAYGNEPFMHGFLINDDALYLSFCLLSNKKLSTLPYLHFLKNSKIPNLDGDTASKFIDGFRECFDRHWADGRRVV